MIKNTDNTKIKKRKGRKALPKNEKKQQITMSFYMSNNDMERHGGEELIREDISRYFMKTYFPTAENDTEPPV